MKWFHHDADSHKDPFIEWLLDNIPKGYQTFFIILEMMSEQYKPTSLEDVKKPIVLRVQTIMERTRVKKKDVLVSLLKHYESNPLNKQPWKVNFLDGPYDGYVELFSIKLVKDADTYTGNRLKKLGIKLEQD